MTSISIDLPDRLAREAERAGLLSSDAIAQLIQERLRAQNVDELFVAMERMADAGAQTPMSPEEVAAEIASVRTKRPHSASN
jgi:cytochrome P450